MKLLIGGIAVLVVVNLMMFFFPPHHRDLLYLMFYMGYDNNIAAWYSSMLLFIAALLAFECSTISRGFNHRDGRAFLLLGLLLLVMSCDEIARLHETIPSRAASYLGLTDLKPEGHGWLLLGGPLVIVVLVVVLVIMTPTLGRNRSSLLCMWTGFAAIIFGGVLLEGVASFLPGGALYRAEVLLEETVEMAGTLLVAWSLIHWRDSMRDEPLESVSQSSQ